MRELKLAIIGSRDFQNHSYAALIIKEFLATDNYAELVSGGAKGADFMALVASKKHEMPIKIYKPDWKLGKFAGMLRNTTIIEYCDHALIFWDYKSKGTRDSINKLAKAKKPFFIVNYLTGAFESYNFDKCF